MTRTERIRKLANAIKDYRGSYNKNTGAWIRPPDHMALARVTCWLKRLDRNIPVDLDRIDKFVSHSDMVKFLKELEEEKASTHKV